MLAVALSTREHLRSCPAVSDTGVAIPENVCDEFGGTAGRVSGDIGNIPCGEGNASGDSDGKASCGLGMLDADVLRTCPGRGTTGICS